MSDSTSSEDVTPTESSAESASVEQPNAPADSGVSSQSGGIAGWAIGVVVAACCAWLLLNFTPLLVAVPEELRGVDMYSPPDQQAKLAEAEEYLKWRNSLTKFAFVGLCIGAIVPLFGHRAGRRGRLPVVAVNAVSGVLLGLAAGQIGLQLRMFLDSPDGYALIGDTNPILIDGSMYAVLSILIGVPVCIALLVSLGSRAVKACLLVPLIAGVAGLIAPAAAGLFPTIATHEFPPRGYGVTAIWLGLFAALVSFAILRAGIKSES